MYDQPVALNGRLYVRGRTRETRTVLEYTPDSDQWAGLPPPPVESFTIATLRGQLLAVGGEDKCTGKKTNQILKFDEQWIQTYAAMPTAVTTPAVMGYHDHLIVAGGLGSSDYIPDVNILNTTSNKWKTAQPLPSTDYYCLVLIEDIMYLVGQYTQTVLRAHVPTLISGAESGVWVRVLTVMYCSSPVAIGNTLLTVGGSESVDGIDTTIVQVYSPTTNQWTRVGDLPEPMAYCHCTVLSNQLFVLTRSVYVATM